MDPRKPDAAGAAGYTVETDALGAVSRVRVTGELDLLAAPRFEQAMAAALTVTTTQLVVDLTGVTLLTSNGIRVLINARDRAEGAGVRLTVAGVAGNRPVSRVFALLRLDEALEFDDGPSSSTTNGTRWH